MTIRTRLTLRFTLLVTAILAAAFSFVYWYCWHFLTSEFSHRLERKAYTIGDLLLRKEVDAQLLGELSRLRRDQLPHQRVTVYDGTGQAIFTTNDSVRLAVDADLLAQVRQTDRVTFHQDPYLGVGIRYRAPSGDYVVVATAEDSFGKEFLGGMRRMLLLLFGAILALIAVSGWLYTGDALLPMQRIENHLNQIFPRTLSERLVADTTDEPGRLSATINRLLDRIEKSFVLQRLFVANVSHELRNPLTQISSQLEVLLLRPRQPQEYQRVIRSVIDDVSDLNRLTHELLQLSRGSTEPDAVVLTEVVRLDEILWDVRQDVGAISSQYTVCLELHMPDDFELLTVRGNSSLLRTALKNLIENACKFADDGKATVVAHFHPQEVDISIANMGSPIPAGELPFIFQPFFRSRSTADVRGYGIGLSLVEQIVRLHQGLIRVCSNPGEPTQVALRLPR